MYTGVVKETKSFNSSNRLSSARMSLISVARALSAASVMDLSHNTYGFEITACLKHVLSLSVRCHTLKLLAALVSESFLILFGPLSPNISWQATNNLARGTSLFVNHCSSTFVQASTSMHTITGSIWFARSDLSPLTMCTKYRLIQWKIQGLASRWGILSSIKVHALAFTDGVSVMICTYILL